MATTPCVKELLGDEQMSVTSAEQLCTQPGQVTAEDKTGNDAVT